MSACHVSAMPDFLFQRISAQRGFSSSVAPNVASTEALVRWASTYRPIVAPNQIPVEPSGDNITLGMPRRATEYQ